MGCQCYDFKNTFDQILFNYCHLADMNDHNIVFYVYFGGKRFFSWAGRIRQMPGCLFRVSLCVFDVLMIANRSLTNVKQTFSLLTQAIGGKRL
jgi:hypothetical protein